MEKEFFFFKLVPLVEFIINSTWGNNPYVRVVKPLLSPVEQKLMEKLRGLQFHSDLAIDKGFLEQLWLRV